jgi:hypothetical protein
MFFWVTIPYRLVGDYHSEEGRAIAVFRVETLQEGNLNTLRTGSFELFKRQFPEFLTILTL